MAPATPVRRQAGWPDIRWRAALAEAPHAFGSTLAEWQGDGDREERWRARLEIPGSLNLVAALNGTPAGMASGVPEPDGLAELILPVRPGQSAPGSSLGSIRSSLARSPSRVTR